jgi:hypothetical protein
MEPDPPRDDDLDPRESTRVRRRDRHTDAECRELMRPGMGKVFKQITDSWAEKAGPGWTSARKRSRKTPG